MESTENGRPHSFSDKPAIIYSDGTREWYKHGKLHRDFDPAIIHANGRLEWYDNRDWINDIMPGLNIPISIICSNL